MRQVVVIIALLCVTPLGDAKAEAFYLKSAKTQKIYGPFEYGQGKPVVLGDTTFEIIRKESIESGDGGAVHDAPSEKAAVEAARPWLDRIDQADYAKAWEEAAPYFQSVLDKRAFTASLEAGRKTLGAVTKRQLESTQYLTAMPSAPDGQYVAINNRVVLEKKSAGLETVIVTKCPDGVWRVSGYYIR